MKTNLQNKYPAVPASVALMGYGGLIAVIGVASLLGVPATFHSPDWDLTPWEARAVFLAAGVVAAQIPLAFAWGMLGLWKWIVLWSFLVLVEVTLIAFFATYFPPQLGIGGALMGLLMGTTIGAWFLKAGMADRDSTGKDARNRPGHRLQQVDADMTQP
jgi:hypothetical protein